MNERKTRFIEGVLKGKLLIDAYRDAGYSPTGAKQGASRLSRDPEVAECIRARRQQYAAQTDVTLDEIQRDLREVRDRCFQRKPVLNRKGQQMETHVDVTCEQCGHVQEVSADAWTFDAAGANTAIANLGRMIAAFTDKSDTVSEETKRSMQRLLESQARAMERVLARHVVPSLAETITRELPEETKRVLEETS
jgi:phage terminase small subunit